MLSYWEKSSFINFDYIIVGSGIVGLSTAASIVEKHPNAKVAVLERGLLPSGASTKNAGFACFGSLTEVISDLKIMPEAKALELVALRYKGLNKLRERLGDKNIGFEHYGGYELLFDENHSSLNEIEKLNNLLQPVFGKNCIKQNDNLIKQFGFSKKVKHLIEHPLEGQIDTGKMMTSLINYVQQKGVNIITGCKVCNIEENTTHIKAIAEDPISQQIISFVAKKIICCTNAFTTSLYPELNIVPGRGQVLISKPIDKLKFKGVFHFDEGFYYFRNVGNRVLFGGGRNIDFKGETTIAFGTTEKILEDLMNKLKVFILPETLFEIEQTWSGIMAFGEDKFPILKRLNDRVIIAARLGGMGVAIGSQLGEDAANIALQD
jgi:glycine/D-amino acid oxidase-like deaminating enzyme